MSEAGSESVRPSGVYRGFVSVRVLVISWVYER